MPPQPIWDASSLAWLAERDPALARLPQALAEAVAHAPGTDWVLHDVQWSPGRGCRLACHLGSGPGRPVPTFRAISVAPGGWSSHDYREDLRLPGLTAATEPDRVTDLLGEVLDHPVASCRVQPVRYRPGSRCVLRYDVTLSEGGATYYAKVFAPSGSPGPAAVTAQVARAAQAFGLVAPVLAVWPQLNAMLGPAVPGRPVSEVLVDPSRPAADRVQTAADLGRLLADFHALPGVSVPVRSAADQHRELAELLPGVRLLDPRLGDRWAAALSRLQQTAPPAPEDLALTHGGFRAGQVLLDRTGLTLLDLDGVSRGDPARDLGTAAAHLTWQATKQPSQAETLQLAGAALLSGYQRQGRSLDPDRLRWWQAAALLQVAARRYRRLETADWPLVPALLDRAEDLIDLPRRAHGAPGGHGAARACEPRDSTSMAELVRQALAPVAAAGTGVRVTSVRQLAAASGRRRVLQCVVVGLDAEGSAPVVAKEFAEARRAELLFEHLRVLSAGPFASGGLCVPQPLALVPEQHLVLYRAGVGTPLNEVDEERALDGVRDAARWLARLHRSGARLPRVLDPTQELVSTRQWAELLGRYDKSLDEPAHRLASGWASARSQPPGGPNRVPIHKDFHAGHVLVHRRTCVIDLDEARLGDAAFDLAHFCAYLHWQGHADQLREAFLSEYATLTGWTDDGSFARYSAYTWLKIAKQLAVGSGPWRAAGRAPGCSVGDALTKGLACLDR